MTELECTFDPVPMRKPSRADLRARGVNRAPPLLRALVLAYQIEEVLQDGRAQSLGDVARQLGVTQPRMTQIMALLHLSPRIQEMILLGDPAQLNGISEHRLRSVTKEMDWTHQATMYDDLVASLGHRPMAGPSEPQ
jgi:hypothetical protein